MSDIAFCTAPPIGGLSFTWSLQRGHFKQYFRDNFQPEVVSDVISGVGVESVGMDVRVKFGDSRSHGFRDIRGAVFVSNEHAEAYHVRHKCRTGVSPKMLEVER